MQVAVSRIVAALAIGVDVSAVAFLTLWLRSGIGHPLHAAVAIFTFAAIYIGIGALIGAFVKGQLEGSLLVVLVFSVDAFSGPQMTSNGLVAVTPTRNAANLLIAAGGGQGSPGGDWVGALAVALVALARRLGGVLVCGTDEGLAMLLRARTATAMAFRDQQRRPLVLDLAGDRPRLRDHAQHRRDAADARDRSACPAASW